MAYVPGRRRGNIPSHGASRATWWANPRRASVPGPAGERASDGVDTPDDDVRSLLRPRREGTPLTPVLPCNGRLCKSIAVMRPMLRAAGPVALPESPQICRLACQMAE